MRLSPQLHKDSEHRSHGLENQLLNTVAVHKSNYWIGFVTDPLTAVLFLFWDTSILHRNIYASMACFATGIFSVSLCEYTLHRWGFHSSRNLAQAGHMMHHDSPKALIGFPWFLTAGFWWSVAYVAVNQLQIPFVLSFMAAFITGYSAYGVVHHVLHHHNMGSRWIRKLRIHHKIHHRFSDVNFGVTSRIWDRVFGTMYYPQDYKMRMSVADKKGET
jgi:sterol desaturase/sphingolipid hydroxylase (fatty acid hydroxylase superfamily)